MWCRNCQQDVPSMRGENFDIILCSRCQTEISNTPTKKRRKSIRRSIRQQLASHTDTTTVTQSEAEIQHSEAQFRNDQDASNSTAQSVDAPSVNVHAPSIKVPRPKLDPLAFVQRKVQTESDESSDSEVEPQLDDLTAEIDRIDRIISVWGESKRLRFDGPHGLVNELDPAEDDSSQNDSQTGKSEDESRPRPDDIFAPGIFVSCLTFGGMLAVLLGVGHGFSLADPGIPKDTAVAAGFVGAGVLGLTIGLWWEVSRLKKILSQNDRC